MMDSLPRRRRLPTQSHSAARRERDVAALAFVLVSNGNCATSGTGWNQAEQQYLVAKNAEEAAQASGMVLGMCAGCPVIDECAQWARTDRYTGLAAGQSWIRGKPKDPNYTINQGNGRRPKDAAA